MQVREDPVFRREGPDIHVDAVLSITQVCFALLPNMPGCEARDPFYLIKGFGDWFSLFLLPITVMCASYASSLLVPFDNSDPFFY